MNDDRKQQHREWLAYEIALYRSAPVNALDLDTAERLERELAAMEKV